MMALEWVAIAVCLILAGRVWMTLPYMQRRRSCSILAADVDAKETKSTTAEAHRPSETVNTLVVLGSGGHTSEMLKLISHLSPKTYTPLCYVVARTDHTSVERIPSEGLRSGRCRVRSIPRSREVGQSYLTSIFTTLVAGLHSASLVMKIRPDLVLVNGPGTCIPVCAAAFALRVMGIRPRSRTVFCESFCRVKSLSLSGRIMYILADRFVVHWPELLERYPRAEFVGQLM